MTERDLTGQTSLSALLRGAVAMAPPGVEALDAECLLAFVLGRNRAGLYARLSDPVAEHHARAFALLWQRRCSGEPYAYLVGEREFYGRRFQVDHSVLIPRAGTETLLEAALARWPVTRAGVVLDAGTGSGALAVSFALQRPDSTVYAVDYSASALRVASKNARDLCAAVHFWRGDWLHAVARHSVDMIISNPPYLGADDSHLPGLIQSGEPRTALVAADDGLADLAGLAAAGLRVLSGGAWLLMEHGWMQGAAVRGMLANMGYTQIVTELDFDQHERVTGGRKGA